MACGSCSNCAEFIIEVAHFDIMFIRVFDVVVLRFRFAHPFRVIQRTIHKLLVLNVARDVRYAFCANNFPSFATAG